ncbi:hypothetical protein RFI_12193 [Reticulomyxa filosa]|uniref:Uncharacterized protein n=1 Tax=Reticulomyxa filosa TaxID=46433 RepID=X6NGW9_RETFI|nr:hypothetical protein RFI_12193 [Reticulomyxa filosa]|eukprot:ETO24954.1 hypothetical protein RFI_12193 [Reticulomyxa filosa]
MEELIQEEIEDEFDRARNWEEKTKQLPLQNPTDIERKLKTVFTEEAYLSAWMSQLQAKNDRKARMEENKRQRKTQSALGVDNQFAEFAPKVHRESINSYGTEPLWMLKTIPDDTMSSSVIVGGADSTLEGSTRYGSFDLEQPLVSSGSDRYTITKVNLK